MLLDFLFGFTDYICIIKCYSGNVITILRRIILEAWRSMAEIPTCP